MPRKEDELQNEANWKLEEAERRGPVANRRSIVSVAFPSHDFRVVLVAAQRADMKVSEYIRVAAVEKARGISSSMMPPVVTLSLTGSARVNEEPSSTNVSSPQVQPILLSSYSGE